MIFTRNALKRKYKDYTRYRSLLRQDFKNRCAYCLTHEYFMGGEAGFEIDHYRPQHGKYARPDLEADYANLYWSCGECNQNKGDIWPSPQEEAQGLGYIDPCTPEGDHEKHWQFHRDGSIEALTPAGEFTEDKLLLWRPFLQHRRAQQFRNQEEVKNISIMLKQKDVDAHQHALLERRLAEIRERLEPPVFDRKCRKDSPPFAPSEPTNDP